MNYFAYVSNIRIIHLIRLLAQHCVTDNLILANRIHWKH